MIISSGQNPKVKELKKLMADKSLVFFDNPKLVEEAYLAGHKIMYVLQKENTTHKTDYGGEVIILTENVFKTFSTTQHSQGLIGVVKMNFLKLQKPTHNFLVLDGLQDPGNVGTLIRSALGANFLDIYLLDCVHANNDKVVRSSMGAIFKTNIYQCSKIEFLSEFKNWNLPLVSCHMNGENIFTAVLPKMLGVVVGNEGNGVSEELKKLSLVKVKIPMKNGLESLNASISGSIVMYEITNRD